MDLITASNIVEYEFAVDLSALNQSLSYKSVDYVKLTDDGFVKA